MNDIKKIVFIVLSVICTHTIYAQNTATYNLTLSVNGLRSTEGNLWIGIYDSEDTYLKDKGQVKKIIFKLSSTNATQLINLRKGSYAISILHDENADSKCNKNAFGIPKEGYGFSNNVKPFLSAPSFNETKFILDSDKSININVIY